MLKGLQSFEKQKALFGWLMKDKADICFLPCKNHIVLRPEVDKIWKSHWKEENVFLARYGTWKGCPHFN